MSTMSQPKQLKTFCLVRNIFKPIFVLLQITKQETSQRKQLFGCCVFWPANTRAKKLWKMLKIINIVLFNKWVWDAHLRLMCNMRKKWKNLVFRSDYQTMVNTQNLLGNLDCWLQKRWDQASHLDESEISFYLVFCTFSQDFNEKWQ